MTHDETLQLLDAYVDGELDTTTMLEFVRHAETCATCTDRIQGRMALKSTIQDANVYYKASHALRRRIETRAAPIKRAATRRTLSAAWSAALAAGIVLMVGSFYAGEQRARFGMGAAEFANAHTRALLQGHAVDVQSSDRHIVKPWFAGRLPFSPPAPQLASSGYDLIGGRVDFVGDRPVAALVYKHGAHFATVFVGAASSSGMPVGERTVGGYLVLLGRVADLDCVFVTDMNAEEARRFRSTYLANAGG